MCGNQLKPAQNERMSNISFATIKSGGFGMGAGSARKVNGIIAELMSAANGHKFEVMRPHTGSRCPNFRPIHKIDRHRTTYLGGLEMRHRRGLHGLRG